MIALLSESLVERLREEENNPVNVRAARLALEHALTFQFQELADRLLANLTLRGCTGEEIWWQHYLTRVGSSENLTLESPAILAFAKEFAAKLVAGRIRPLSISDLGNVEIRILNGHAKLWDDCRINRQLCRLGSSCRVAVLGANRLLVNQLRALLGRQGSLPIDARFIFGRVGPMSSWPLGPIFNFEEEIAVSPFLNPKGAGLNYENCVVVRQPIVRTLLKPKDENHAKLSALHILFHEMIHVTGFRAPYPRTYLEAYWEEDTAWDILRFTETPKTFEDLTREFDLNFDNPVLADANKTLGHERFPPPPYSLRELLDRLVDKGVLQRAGEPELFKCNSFEEGKQWAI